MQKTAVINVVGLTSNLIGKYTPFLSSWSSKGKVTSVDSVLPAVTCPVQATYLTGEMPDKHGIVANGWYYRDTSEIRFWMRSGQLIQGKKIWDRAREADSAFTCANIFWRYAAYSGADYTVIERPMYKADGVKVPDVYTEPMSFRDKLQGELGTFPLFNFWGPNTTIKSSQWIADAAKMVSKEYDPTLSLVYLPHLDYCLQRVGPDDSSIRKDLREIDRVCEDLVTFYESKGTRVVILSEYGIDRVSKPVSLNRVLRRKGYITVRDEMGDEILDPGSSKAFAVADHQVAHVYIRDSNDISQVKKLLEGVSGVEKVLDKEDQKEYNINHSRSGELVVIAEPESWFTYYYWLDDEKAPDFAPTVSIHSKPGYDPAEMLTDPRLTFPKLKAARRLLQKKLGFRYTMDLIPMEGSGVKGSHGRMAASPDKGPLLISQQKDLLPSNELDSTEVHDVILSHLLVNQFEE